MKRALVGRVTVMLQDFINSINKKKKFRVKKKKKFPFGHSEGTWALWHSATLRVLKEIQALKTLEYLRHSKYFI